MSRLSCIFGDVNTLFAFPGLRERVQSGGARPFAFFVPCKTEFVVVQKPVSTEVNSVAKWQKPVQTDRMVEPCIKIRHNDRIDMPRSASSKRTDRIPPSLFFAPTNIWYSIMSHIPASTSEHASLYSQAAKNQHPANVLAFADDLEQRLAIVDDASQLAAVFKQCGVREEYRVTYAREDLKILVACQDLAETLGSHLSIANQLAIQCAPILVRQIPTRDLNLQVVVTHEPGFPDPIDRYPSLAGMRQTGRLDHQAFHFFMDEVCKLFHIGFINESIVDDPGSLIVNPQSGLIYATAWTSMIKSNKSKWDEYSAEVAAAIGLIPGEFPFW